MLQNFVPNNFYGGKLTARDVAGFRLEQSVYPSFLRMPMHSHEPASLGIVMSGGYSEQVGSRSRDCVQSTVVFHPAESSHAVNFHNHEVSIFRAEIRADWLDRVRDHVALPSQSTTVRDSMIGSLGRRLFVEFNRVDSSSSLAIEGIMMEMIAEISRVRTSTTERRAPKWLGVTQQILHDRLADAPSLVEIADAVGVHPVYLAREFRRFNNCSVGDYVRQLRLEFACRELAGSTRPLANIAISAGFYDQSHFANTFKRAMGITPADYRAMTRH